MRTFQCLLLLAVIISFAIDLYFGTFVLTKYIVMLKEINSGRNSLAESILFPVHESLVVESPHSSYFSQLKIEQSFSIGKMITPKIGCVLARWFYQKPGKNVLLDDCRNENNDRNLFFLNPTLQVKARDTIYVPIFLLEEFITLVLPKISEKFVLISGQTGVVGVKMVNFTLMETLLNHENLVHVFLQNRDRYAPYPLHPKVSPWPYGIKEKKKLIHKQETFQHEYEEEFFQPVVKDQLIFVSSLYRADTLRSHIPNGPRLDHTDYLREMHRSLYVLSPNGDRKECYRHYEAIGLGTIPITELDPLMFFHLVPAPVIFNQTSWNLTELKENLPHENIGTNRNMVLTPYWMEWVENIAQLSNLRWWDEKSNEERFLVDWVKNGSKIV